MKQPLIGVQRLALYVVTVATASVMLYGVAPAQNAGRVPPRLTLSVLPVFIAATGSQDMPEEAADADGYGAITAPSGTPGPASLIQRWIGKDAPVDTVLAHQYPEEPTPLQLHTVLTRFDHRRGSGTSMGWEAVVEIGVRITDTRTQAELCSGFYSATEPARGPLSPRVRRKVLAAGLGAYLDRPLGKAFEQAALEALYGNVSMLQAPASDEPQNAVLPILAKLQWEGMVIRQEEGGFRIASGTEHGLQQDDLLSPFSNVQDASGSTFSRKRVPGVLRVRRVMARAAIIENVPGEGVPAGTSFDGVYLGRGSTGGFTESIVVGEGVSVAFREALRNKLNYLENTSNGRWRADTIQATVLPMGKAQSGRVRVQVQLQDVRKLMPIPLGSWTGTVSDSDSVAAAEECVASIWPNIVAKGDRPRPTTPTPAPTPARRRAPVLVKRDPEPVTLPVRAAAPAGKVPRLIQNRRQTLSLGLTFDPSLPVPENHVFRDEQRVRFRLAGSARTFGVLYNFDSNRELAQVWPNPDRSGGIPEAGEIPTRPGTIVPAIIGGVLGQELMILVAWSEPSRARDMARSKPDSLTELSRVIRELSAKPTRVVSAEPSKLSVESLFMRAEPAARQLAGGESTDYATAWLSFRSER